MARMKAARNRRGLQLSKASTMAGITCQAHLAVRKVEVATSAIIWALCARYREHRTIANVVDVTIPGHCKPGQSPITRTMTSQMPSQTSGLFPRRQNFCIELTGGIDSLGSHHRHSGVHALDDELKPPSRER